MTICTIPLKIYDFNIDTADLDIRELGIYFRIFVAAYTRDIPNDDVKLARIVKCKPREIKKARPMIEERFKTDAENKLILQIGKNRRSKNELPPY